MPTSKREYLEELLNQRNDIDFQCFLMIQVLQESMPGKYRKKANSLIRQREEITQQIQKYLQTGEHS